MPPTTLILCLAFTLCASLAVGQSPCTGASNCSLAVGITSDLPDAPSSVTKSNSQSPAGFQRQELLADDPYYPLSQREKFTHWIHRTYAPATFVGVGVSATYAAANSDLRYCCGPTAWAQQYAANLADTETRAFFGNYLFPALLGQDPRYLPKRSGGVVSRAWYAATRVLVTRNDNGNRTFNSSEVLGVAFSRALSNAYCRENDRTWGRTGNRIAGSISGDVGGNLLSEFMPDLMRLFHAHAPRRLQSLGDRLALSSTSSQY